MWSAEYEGKSLAGDIRAFWPALFALLAVAGGATFVYGISGELALRAWQAYLVNFIFWAGLSFGCVIFAATLNMADAKWGRPVKRLAESFAAFLPVVYILFWGLYFGREHLFVWVREPVPEKAAWLNVPFLFARKGAALLALTLLCLALV
ncbi:MAG TPA: hypothetical protein VLS90_05655, partial [Thermodesulfobacteriota bacterium]|nr:hypothetical protein [Thermodesulfobacteriota bacterium]